MEQWFWRVKIEGCQQAGSSTGRVVGKFGERNGGRRTGISVVIELSMDGGVISSCSTRNVGGYPPSPSFRVERRRGGWGWRAERRFARRNDLNIISSNYSRTREQQSYFSYSCISKTKNKIERILI